MINHSDELARYLTREGTRPFTIFLGSTISCTPPAETPSVQEILESMFDELLSALGSNADLRRRANVRCDPIARRRLEKIPFESVWERVARVIGGEAVAHTLKRLCGIGDPNFHHEALAWLLHRGHARIVLTTNYDEFLERALGFDGSDAMQFRRFSNHDRMVVEHCSPASHSSHDIRCIKLHGTVSIPETMAFMFPQITAGLPSETASRLRELLEAAPVLFAGYGCNDWDLRQVVRTPIDSVWVTHRDDWSHVDERCRAAAEHHRSARWYRSDLRTGQPSDSVFVQLVNALGHTGSWPAVHDSNNARRYHVIAELGRARHRELDRAEKLAILGELLDSLALRVASDVFREAARYERRADARGRLDIAAYVAMSHDFSMAAQQQERGKELLRRREHGTLEHLAVLTQFAFLELLGGSKWVGLLATFKLICKTHLLERAARARRLCERTPTEWSPADRQLAVTITKAREVFAHNILRLAWFHVPGSLGAVLRAIRAIGVRWYLASWARRVLRANRPLVAGIGSLASNASLERESAHSACLLGRFDEAIKQGTEAEEALAWGQWYQWQANAVRTRGWVWLWIARRYGQLRHFADRQAEDAFYDALTLANKYVGPEGEMVGDRIKALLELKRLALLRGGRFEWEEQLQADLATIRERSPEVYQRSRAIAESPPRTREPLG